MVPGRVPVSGPAPAPPPIVDGRPCAANSASTAPSRKRTTPGGATEVLEGLLELVDLVPGAVVAARHRAVLRDRRGQRTGRVLRDVHRHDAGVTRALHRGGELVGVRQRPGLGVLGERVGLSLGLGEQHVVADEGDAGAARLLVGGVGAAALDRPSTRPRLLLVGDLEDDERGRGALAVRYGGHGDPVADPRLDVLRVVEVGAAVVLAGSPRRRPGGCRRAAELLLDGRELSGGSSRPRSSGTRSGPGRG